VINDTFVFSESGGQLKLSCSSVNAPGTGTYVSGASMTILPVGKVHATQH
jgi:hypothetical protein